MPSLESVLANIPGYGGYIAKRQMNMGEENQQLQQAGALQGIMQKARAEQQLQEYRAGLRPDMTPEEQVAHAARYAGPEGVMKVGTAHLDRQAQQKMMLHNAELAADTKIQQTSMMLEGRIQTAQMMGASAQQLEAMRQQGRTQLEGMREQGRQALEAFKATIDKGSKAPSGYRATPQGNLEAIPGGPADLKIQAAAAKQGEATNKVQKISEDIDTLVTMLEQNPNIAGGRGFISRGMESVGGFIDPTAPPTDAHLYESRIGDLKARVQLLRADKRFSKEAMARMDKIIQGSGLGQNAATSIATLRDMQEKMNRDASIGAAPAESSYPTATNPQTGEKLIYKDGKWQTP